MSSALSVVASRPVKSMVLIREVVPEASVIEDLDTPVVAARRRISSALASPSTGGAANETTRRPSDVPRIAEREARGLTRT